ncbi:MAG: hypothetical protein CTY15_01430 [Methylocystis sp.]|nr:MAG: hypothetical protein CTY15_01430 [Methylocystis sp.]
MRVFLVPGNRLNFRPLFKNDPTYALAQWLYSLNVTEVHYIIDTLVAGLFLAALGFFFDAMLRSRGFGASGNAWLLLIGAALSAWAWSVWAPLAYRGKVQGDVLAAAFGAGLLLVLGALVRHAILSTLEDFGSGAAEVVHKRKPQARSAQDVIRRRAR